MIEYQASEYWCDGLDNDCDGVTDEGASFMGVGLGGVCAVDGECGEGVVECRAATRTAVCSSGPGGSNNKATPEVCDGLDNDCDGELDNGLDFQGIPMGLECEGLGLCGPGVVQCHESLPTVICSSMAGGSADESLGEECDGKDNDCDGDIDENLFLADLTACPEDGVCGAFKSKLSMVCEQGQWFCDASGIEGYNQGEEYLCDGQDNDCDGSTDEDFQLDDLDGSKRAMAASCGVGACEGGVVQCDDDQHTVTCSSWSLSSPEYCDGKDNDCDGMTDDGLEYEAKSLGESCKGHGICGLGLVECSSTTGEATCSSNADGTASEAVIEACDLLDNDCDGVTDEEIGLEVPCNMLGVCQDSAGLAACSLGEWVCEFDYLPDWEAEELTCDEMDNDCDGTVDEGAEKKFADAVESIGPTSLPGRDGYAWSVVKGPTGIYLGGGLAQPFPSLPQPLCMSDFWHGDPASGHWEKLASMPIPRSDHSLTRIPGSKTVLALGGQCGGEIAGSAHLYSIATDSWEQVAVGDEISRRYGHAAVGSADSGEVFVLGGMGDLGPALSFRFGPAPTDHGLLPQAPAVSFAAYCSSSDALEAYIFGGVEDGELSSALYLLNMEDPSFEALGDGGPGPRKLGTLSCQPQRLILAGGVGANDEYLADIWEYDLLEGSWQLLEEHWRPLARPLIAEGGPGLHILGGVTETGGWSNERFALVESQILPEQANTPGALAGALSALNRPEHQVCLLGGFYTGAAVPRPGYDVWCLDLVEGLWTRLESELPWPVAFASLSYDPNQHRLLLVGGGQFDPGQQPQPLSPICRYAALSLQTGQWSDFGECGPGDSGPGSLSAHAAGVRWKDLSLWIYGGIGDSGLSNQVWRYGLDTGQWSQVEIVSEDGGAGLPVRYGHALWIREETGQIIVGGGVAGADLAGAMLLIDPSAGTWRQLVSLPWLQSPFPAMFYDDVSDDGLLVQGEQSTGTHFVLSGKKLHSIEVLDFATPVVPLSLSAHAYDPWARAGVRYGGLNSSGLSAGFRHQFNMVCY